MNLNHFNLRIDNMNAEIHSKSNAVIIIWCISESVHTLTEAHQYTLALPQYYDITAFSA